MRPDGLSRAGLPAVDGYLPFEELQMWVIEIYEVEDVARRNSDEDAYEPCPGMPDEDQFREMFPYLFETDS